MDIGNAIKQLRAKEGLNQKEFAIRIGISQTYLSQIEHGHRKPSLEVLSLISNDLKIPLPVMFWFCIDESDIDKSKIEAYKILKPTIDAMISSII